MRDRTCAWLERLVARRLHLDLSIADPTNRGFSTGEAGKKRRLQEIGETFVDGYNGALDTPPEAFSRRESTCAPSEQGFMYEGAAMAYAMLDALTPTKEPRLHRFLTHDGMPHSYMVHVGAGWAMAKLPWLRSRFVDRFEPIMRGLVIDGWGFAEMYLNADRTLRSRNSSRLNGNWQCYFDQGMGRGMWFASAADPELLSRMISVFPAKRHGDLWAGVGLAATYAGVVGEADLRKLRRLSGAFTAQLAQGCAFAIEARSKAGNAAPHSDLACRILTDWDAIVAVERVQQARNRAEAAPGNGDVYERWRHILQSDFLEKRRAAACSLV